MATLKLTDIYTTTDRSLSAYSQIFRFIANTPACLARQCALQMLGLREAVFALGIYQD